MAELPTQSPESPLEARRQSTDEPLSERTARAVLGAILDSEVLGVALLRPPSWAHVMANARYARFAGTDDVVGTPLEALLPSSVVPLAQVEEVARTRQAQRLGIVRLRARGEDGEAVFASISLLPAEDTAGVAVVVLLEDMTSQVRERLNAGFVAALATEVASSKDSAEGIREAVKRTALALGADAASLFVVDIGRRRMHGALVGWDWTRTSFVADIEAWPTVSRALASGIPVMITAREAAGAEAGWFESRGIGATFCVPMRAEGKAIGVLFFDFHDPPTLESGARDLAASVAEHCASTLAGIARSELEELLR